MPELERDDESLEPSEAASQMPSAQDISLNDLPYLTDSLPGTGGVLKQAPDDFFVEELPLYPAAGEGEFAWLFIEKREFSTSDLVSHIARTLRIHPGEIGTAGRKDKVAVTRQYVSLPARLLPDPQVLETDRVRVLETSRHRNKLRTGHLRGNRFRLVLRDLPPEALTLAQAIKAVIDQRGFLNYYGEQRFGFADNTDSPGFKLLRGEPTPWMTKGDLRFSLSAAQSRLFNDWAARRVRDGLSHSVIPGDVMQVTASGGCFVAEDVPVEQARFDQREIVITGPIFGPKMRAPALDEAEREQQILDDWRLPREAFERFRKLTQGTRRPLLVWPGELAVVEVPGGLEFQFSLPAGAYATGLLREFQKLDRVTASH